jgi:hypothetical protein
MAVDCLQFTISSSQKRASGDDNNEPISATPPCSASQVGNVTVPSCTAFLARSRSFSSTASNSPVCLFFARRIPLSSNVSRMAAMRYTRLSTCRSAWSGSGTTPSWAADTLPPGKTWAEGKEEDVCTRWRRRTWLRGEMRITLEEWIRFYVGRLYDVLVA